MGISEIVRQIGIYDAIFSMWRFKYVNMETNDAKWLKDSEVENNRLKKLVTNFRLENRIFQVC